MTNASALVSASRSRWFAGRALRRAPWTRAQILFLAFAFYMAVPLLDVPFWGISLSAPILMLVALEVATGQARVHWARYEGWLALAVWYWLGCAMSLVANQVWGGRRITPGEAYELVRWAYWMTAFALSMFFCANPEFRGRVCKALSAGVTLLAGLRVVEAVAFGFWGHEKSYFMSPNAYGWEFTTFAPFAVALPATLRGGRRRWALAALGMVLLAWVLSGSRGSWVALSAGLCVFLALCLASPRALPRYLGALAGGLALAGLVFWLARERLSEPVGERVRSFQTLERDTSYNIRKLMIQKGLKMFWENPLFGAGLDRFKSTSVPLERPPILRYAGQEHFNVKSSHNSYIAVLAETGLAGSVPLALLLAALALKGLAAAMRAARRGDLWSVAAYASFVGMSIHLWVLTGLTGTAPWFIYGLLAGIIVSSGRYRRVGLIPAPGRIVAARALGA